MEEFLEVDFVKWMATIEKHVVPLVRIYGAVISFQVERPPDAGPLVEVFEKAKLAFSRLGVVMHFREAPAFVIGEEVLAERGATMLMFERLDPQGIMVTK